MFPAVVDRIEGEIAVIMAEGLTLKVPARLLPPGAGEGSHLRFVIEIDPAAESRAREDVATLRKRLSSDDDGGDIDL